MTDGAFRKLLEATSEVSRHPDMPASKAEGNEVDAAVAALREWIGLDVSDEQIKAVLWGMAMESKNSDVVDTAIKSIHDEMTRGAGDEVDKNQPYDEEADLQQSDKAGMEEGKKGKKKEKVSTMGGDGKGQMKGMAK